MIFPGAALNIFFGRCAFRNIFRVVKGEARFIFFTNVVNRNFEWTKHVILPFFNRRLSEVIEK
jgi:hypothetical protein